MQAEILLNSNRLRTELPHSNSEPLGVSCGRNIAVDDQQMIIVDPVATAIAGKHSDGE